MEKRLADSAPGATLIVLATDLMAKVDIPLYCRQNGHDYEFAEAEGVLRFLITKKA